MNTEINAKDLSKMAKDYISSKTSTLLEEVLSECITNANKGKYRYIHFLNDNHDSEDIRVLVDNLKSRDFDVNLQTHNKIKFQPKWYQFNKRVEYETSIMVIIDWNRIIT